MRISDCSSDVCSSDLFLNIFGGIVRCDMIAEGIIAAVKEVGVQVPVIVRLEGTNVEEGKALLKSSGLAITPADDINDGARKAVAAVAYERPLGAIKELIKIGRASCRESVCQDV